MTKHNDQERALRKRFSDIEDEILAGKHNAQSVFTAMRTAALYIGQPAAQDVSGLVEALEASNLLLKTQRHACSSSQVCHLLDSHIQRNDAALTAHRAQAQGGDT